MRLGPYERLAAGNDQKVGFPAAIRTRHEVAGAVFVLPPAACRLESELRLFIWQRRPGLDERIRRSEEEVDVDPVIGGDEAWDISVPDELQEEVKDIESFRCRLRCTEMCTYSEFPCSVRD